MKQNCLIICIISLLFSLDVSAVHASNLGASLTPPILEAHLRPGKSVSSTFVLKNLSDTEAAFTLRLVPFLPADEYGNPQLKPNLKPEWLKYINISNANIALGEPFTLAPNQSQEIILSIDIPTRASQSDYYLTLLASTGDPDAAAGTSLGVAIGSNILITVSPISNPPALVKIVDFFPTPDSYFFRYGNIYVADNLTPIIFEAKAKNLGKFLTKTAGSLDIITPTGKLASKTSLLPYNLLANSERVIEGSPSGELVFKPSLLSLGQFTVNLDLESGNSNSHSEIYLLLLPIRSGLLIIITAAILILISNFKKTNNGSHKK